MQPKKSKVIVKEITDDEQRNAAWASLRLDPTFSLKTFIKICGYEVSGNDLLKSAPILSLLIVLDSILSEANGKKSYVDSKTGQEKALSSIVIALQETSKIIQPYLVMIYRLLYNTTSDEAKYWTHSRFVPYSNRGGPPVQLFEIGASGEVKPARNASLVPKIVDELFSSIRNLPRQMTKVGPVSDSFYNFSLCVKFLANYLPKKVEEKIEPKISIVKETEIVVEENSEHELVTETTTVVIEKKDSDNKNSGKPTTRWVDPVVKQITSIIQDGYKSMPKKEFKQKTETVLLTETDKQDGWKNNNTGSKPRTKKFSNKKIQ